MSAEAAARGYAEGWPLDGHRRPRSGRDCRSAPTICPSNGFPQGLHPQANQIKLAEHRLGRRRRIVQAPARATLARGQTTVHCVCAAVSVGGVVAGEVGDHPRDFLGARESAHCPAGCVLLAVQVRQMVEDAVGHRRVGKARTDDVAANAARPEFESHAADQAE